MQFFFGFAKNFRTFSFSLCSFLLTLMLIVKVQFFVFIFCFSSFYNYGGLIQVFYQFTLYKLSCIVSFYLFTLQMKFLTKNMTWFLVLVFLFLLCFFSYCISLVAQKKSKSDNVTNTIYYYYEHIRIIIRNTICHGINP